LRRTFETLEDGVEEVATEKSVDKYEEILFHEDKTHILGLYDLIK
jgi:hypothetical protein